jgi:mono/diheme cytochrome c family protein
MPGIKHISLLTFAAIWLAGCGSAANNSAIANANKPASNANAATKGAANANSQATAQIDGKELYTESCQICHKDTGKGGPTTVDGKKIKPADLTAGHSKKHSDDDLVKDIQEGSPDDGMPAFKEKLKPEEIRAIVGYIRTLQQQ